MAPQAPHPYDAPVSITFEITAEAQLPTHHRNAGVYVADEQAT